jgi:hypothetical protein
MRICGIEINFFQLRDTYDELSTESTTQSSRSLHVLLETSQSRILQLNWNFNTVIRLREAAHSFDSQQKIQNS